MKNENRGLRHLMNSTYYSWKGLSSAFRNEAAFRQEIFLVTVLLPTSFFIADSFLVWAILVIPLFTLLITELLNSAIEAAVDRVGRDFHKLSGLAKDMASAAVFMNLSLIALIWGIYILNLLKVIDW